MNEDIIFKYFPELDGIQRERMTMLGPLYREWNSRINVISRKDMDNLYVHHVLHSLALVRFIKDHGLRPESIFDAGTGGGFPGIPMAVAMPECRFTLCDSIAKKIRVVTEVATALGLDNVTPVCSRTEAIKDRKYDFVVSRAVTELSRFVPLTRHLYTEGILYLKGGDVQPEIEDCVRRCRIAPEQVSVALTLRSILLTNNRILEYETYISTVTAQAPQQTRFPRAYVHPQRTPRSRSTPSSRPQETDSIIRRSVLTVFENAQSIDSPARRSGCLLICLTDLS